MQDSAKPSNEARWQKRSSNRNAMMRAPSQKETCYTLIPFVSVANPDTSNTCIMLTKSQCSSERKATGSFGIGLWSRASDCLSDAQGPALVQDEFSA